GILVLAAVESNLLDPLEVNFAGPVGRLGRDCGRNHGFFAMAGLNRNRFAEMLQGFLFISQAFVIFAGTQMGADQLILVVFEFLDEIFIGHRGLAVIAAFLEQQRDRENGLDVILAFRVFVAYELVHSNGIPDYLVVVL